MRSNQHTTLRILKHEKQSVVRIVIIQWYISETGFLNSYSSSQEFFLVAKHNRDKWRVLCMHFFYDMFGNSLG